jgi:hypothetical protein
VTANFNRYAYALGNPYRYFDPDGRCEAATGTHICLESTVQLKDNHADVKLSAQGEKYAKSNAGVSSVNSMKQSEEKVKAVVDDGKGNLVSRNLGNTTTKESDAGHSATGEAPEGTQFIEHGHVNSSMVDQPGKGDSQVPLEANVPNVIVSGENNPRVGVREIEGGKLQTRMLRGDMTTKEQKLLLEHMNQAAEIYNNGH